MRVASSMLLLSACLALPAASSAQDLAVPLRTISSTHETARCGDGYGFMVEHEGQTFLATALHNILECDAVQIRIPSCGTGCMIRAGAEWRAYSGLDFAMLPLADSRINDAARASLTSVPTTRLGTATPPSSRSSVVIWGASHTPLAVNARVEGSRSGVISVGVQAAFLGMRFGKSADTMRGYLAPQTELLFYTTSAHAGSSGAAVTTTGGALIGFHHAGEDGVAGSCAVVLPPTLPAHTLLTLGSPSSLATQRPWVSSAWDLHSAAVVVDDSQLVADPELDRVLRIARCGFRIGGELLGSWVDLDVRRSGWRVGAMVWLGVVGDLWRSGDWGTGLRLDFRLAPTWSIARGHYVRPDGAGIPNDDIEHVTLGAYSELGLVLAGWRLDDVRISVGLAGFGAVDARTVDFGAYEFWSAGGLLRLSLEDDLTARDLEEPSVELVVRVTYGPSANRTYSGTTAPLLAAEAQAVSLTAGVGMFWEAAPL